MAQNINNAVTERGVTPYGVAYVEINGHRFLDFKDPKTCERVGTKNILPIRPDKFEEATFRAFKDPAYDIWFGIRTGWDANGDPTFRKIKIVSARYYNLELPVDAMEYAVVKHHEIIEGSLRDKGKAFLKIDDPEVEAAKEAKKIIDAQKPVEIAATLVGTKLENFARVLGVIVKDNSEVIVRKGVLEKAQKSPAKFMELWEASDRSYYEVLHRAVEYAVITDDNIKGYLYKNSVPIGLTPMAAVATFNKDRNLFAAIQQECEEIREKALAPKAEQDVPASGETAMEKRIRELEAENASLKEGNEEISTTEQSGEDDNNPQPPADDMDLAMYFRGKPVTGALGDKGVWTKKELIAIGVNEFSIDVAVLNKLQKKEDIALELLRMEGKSIGNSPGDDSVSGKTDALEKDDETF